MNNRTGMVRFRFGLTSSIYYLVWTNLFVGLASSSLMNPKPKIQLLYVNLLSINELKEKQQNDDK